MLGSRSFIDNGGSLCFCDRRRQSFGKSGADRHSACKCLHYQGTHIMALSRTHSRTHSRAFRLTHADPLPTPGELEITKSPENENVKPGGTASFITQAVNYTSCKWYLSKDGETVEADRAEERFPGLKVAGDGTEKLILSAIPKSLDGWSVYCVFKGAAGSVSTSKARLHVSDSAKPKPTQIPAAAVTQSPVVTLVPTAEPMQTAAPHVHSFSAQWKSDDTRHWQECECGEKVNLADHVVAEWTTVTEATKEQDGIDEGTCAVCGRTVQRSTAYRPPVAIKVIIIAAIALVIATAIVSKMRRNSRKRWRLR